MPLASDRSASLHRKQKVEAEKKEAARRRRLSLPRTIPSATNVTTADGERRSRRLSERFSISSKENKGFNAIGRTPYFQVAAESGGMLTRSQKKAKKKSQEGAKGGLVLAFSPPDQEKNKRQESLRLAESEHDRAQRVKQARDSGRLLIYSPSNLPINASDDVSNFESPTLPEVLGNVAVSSTEASDLTDCNHTNNPVTEQMAQDVKGLKEQLQTLIETNTADNRNVAHGNELEKQQLVVNMLTETNGKLEKTVESIQKELSEVKKSSLQEKEELLVEKTRLESRLESAEASTGSRLEELVASKEKLESSVSNLQAEKIELTKRSTELEQKLHMSHEKIAEANRMLEALKEESLHESTALKHNAAQLQISNANFSRELDSVTNERNDLSLKVVEYESELQQFRENAVRELEAEREKTDEEIQSLDTLVQRLESELASYDKEIAKLKSELEEAKRENKKEREQFAVLNEDSATAFERMQNDMLCKNEEIDVLKSKLNEMEATVEEKIGDNAELEHKILELQEDFSKRSDELDSALKETIAQLEALETSKRSLQNKLDAVLLELERVQAAKEDAMGKSNETSSELEFLRKALEQERKRSAEEKKRAEGFESEWQLALEERDEARNNMEGFDGREEELYRKLRESDRIRRDLHGRVMQLMGNIRVFVRVRPPLGGELAADLKKQETLSSHDTKKRKREPESSLFRFPGVYDRADKHTSAEDASKNFIEVTEPFKDRGGLKDRRKKWRYGFDGVFSPEHGQHEVWVATEPLVQSAVDGYNVTLFAYGQTGSGKTYTMLGVPDNEGIISRAITKLFDSKREMEAVSRGGTKVNISVELLEVYNEQVRDLLAPNSGPDGRQLSLKVTSQEVVGNIVVGTDSREEVLEVLRKAQDRRCVKSTSSNAESSRSHMLFTIHFQITATDGTTRNGKLNICDLAGSERLSKSGAHNEGGALLKETQHINKSLSALSNVIERLQAGNANVPFRESKLTFLLKNSLEGNSKTLAIVCCNPLPSHFHESHCSLRFAQKVNKVDLKQATANFS